MKRVSELDGKYMKIIVVSLEIVTSSQVKSIRRIIYITGGTLIVGINTIIRKALGLRAATGNLSAEFAKFKKLGPASMNSKFS
jgi:ribosomal protein L10